ncbi:MAG: type II secretion system F family protein, partial [Paracoccaceae bacterium]|nr:type II secretion system F family protein [Paracoccaceae bacterium]
MINTINQIIVAKLGPLGPIMIVAGLGLLLVIVSLPLLMQRRPDPMERLQKSVKSEAEQKKKSRDQALRTSDRNDKLEKFATFLEPQNEKDMSDARLQMLRAGYRSKNAVRTFHAVQFIAGVGALLVGVIYTVILNQTQKLGFQAELLYTLLPGALGYYAPKRYVQQRVQKRQNEIINGFPDALDMMLVCVEAGQSLDQSILRVAREMRTGYPALSEEFELVSHEVRAGKERVSVLRDMSERVGVPDVASFVTVMIQS